MTSQQHLPTSNIQQSTRSLVRAITEADQDFEWYPTTAEIIACVNKSIRSDDSFRHQEPAILDCGAGDGRVLTALTKGRRYAIEKAKLLIQAMPRDIYIVGTDFAAQTLIDKKVDVVFSNPPYSQFQTWATKIIREAHAAVVYLVIPERWQQCEDIAAAIKAREAKAKILGEFDFLNAERAARARVHVVRISMGETWRSRRSGFDVDPFSLWFDEYFKVNANQSKQAEYAANDMLREKVSQNVKNEIVQGGDLIATLERLYQRDLANLIKTYRAVCEIDSDILRELEVNVEGLKGALKAKISGLKNIYWKELFGNLNRVTDRLTSRSRQSMLDKLAQHVTVDFTESNAHALLIWVIKNANTYFDDQLIEMVEQLTEQANITAYKSNQRTFGAEHWRYCSKPEGLERYKIEYRVVLARCGGLSTSSYHRDVNGLSERAADFLDDLRAVAANLNFDVSRFGGSRQFNWDGSGARTFEYWDSFANTPRTLFEVRAFKNGNLHIRFDQEFICKLNVEFGRLKGWLKCAGDAAKELDIAMDAAEASFKVNQQLAGPEALRLGFTVAAA